MAFLFAGLSSGGAADSSKADKPPGSPDRLVQILLGKGILTLAEVESLGQGSPAEQQARLIGLLRAKGVLSVAEAETLGTPPAAAQVSPALVASTAPVIPATISPPIPGPQAAKAEAPKVIPAVAPLRVLQLEPSLPNGMIPDIKLGSGAKLKIYGLLKASSIYDSSAPYGTDMPLPAFMSTTTNSGTTGFDPGPTGGSEWHTKARFARIGTAFDWPDVSVNTAVTGKLEFDFEGNYTRSLNRNISTIRSSQASIRLAYGRIDRRLTAATSIFGLFGQDWTPFGSSTLPPIFETTGMGLGFGTLYERAPQFRFGVGHKIGGSRNVFLQPEFAIVMPAYGNDPKAIDNQLGYGERQGADSGRPEVQGRIVTQWQLDRAPAVAPAQFIVSFVQGERTAPVRAADVPLCPATTAGCPADNPKIFQQIFAQGAKVSSDRWGWTGELQLPTRYMTIISKYWNGSDLRWYFVGSLFSNFNDKGVLDPGSPVLDAYSNDQSSSVVFGFRDGVPVIAPQRSVRSQGGFLNLGFPLSRIFNADAGGRNSGWVLYFHYALDVANADDVRRLGNQRQKNDLAAGTLNWRFNNWVTFTLEESYYRTRAAGDPTGVLPFPTYRGFPTRSWHDFRSEIGPTFSF
jgi:hypothetical protein